MRKDAEETSGLVLWQEPLSHRDQYEQEDRHLGHVVDWWITSAVLGMGMMMDQRTYQGWLARMFCSCQENFLFPGLAEKKKRRKQRLMKMNCFATRQGDPPLFHAFWNPSGNLLASPFFPFVPSPAVAHSMNTGLSVFGFYFWREGQDFD